MAKHLLSLQVKGPCNVAAYLTLKDGLFKRKYVMLDKVKAVCSIAFCLAT